ncbi:MAG: GNAT family N-acetyltransferase [Sandaracinaceae bacterium]|nr:GNAT family N-acetyltransferase [Sandaracinaceae bacterium]
MSEILPIRSNTRTNATVKSDTSMETVETPSRSFGVSARSFSQIIYGIQWSDHFPIRLEDGVEVDVASVEDATAFMAAHYARIFGSDPEDRRFFSDPSSPARARFLAGSDRFLFREHGQAIGLLVGNPVDWSTYYWRSVAFLPEHQGRGLLAAVLAHTDRVMREAGVVRVEGRGRPINYKQVRLLLRLGYCVTGSSNSDRWGTMLRLTKYLDASAEERFVTQFCRDTSLASCSTDRRPTEGGSHEEVRTRDLLMEVGSSSRLPMESGVFLRRIT